MTTLSSDFLTIVSGLPRSGTSLMMQALHAGGVPLLVDEKRAADEHNPRGYFEYDAVKHLERDSDWLVDHKGKAVKIIYRLLPFVPDDVECRVLFLRRDLAEVVASQNRMLGENDPGQWVKIFSRELEKYLPAAIARSNFRVLEVEHRELLENPERAFERVNSHLGDGLDIKAMISSVDSTLYRNRS